MIPTTSTRLFKKQNCTKLFLRFCSKLLQEHGDIEACFQTVDMWDENTFHVEGVNQIEFVFGTGTLASCETLQL